jgi:hypothetical protein
MKMIRRDGDMDLWTDSTVSKRRKWSFVYPLCGTASSYTDDVEPLVLIEERHIIGPLFYFNRSDSLLVYNSHAVDRTVCRLVLLVETRLSALFSLHVGTMAHTGDRPAAFESQPLMYVVIESSPRT